MTTASGSYNFFDRKVLLRITTLDNRVFELTQDFRIVFEVKKVLRAEPDPATIEIYNLGPELRKAFAKPFNPKKTAGAKVELFVGYKSQGTVTRIYSGEIQEGISRYTAPDWITKLICGVDYDRFLNHVVGKNFKKGTDPLDAIKSILSVQGIRTSIAAQLVDKVRKSFNRNLSFMDNLKNIFGYLSKQFNLSITNTDQGGPVQISELGYPNNDPRIILNQDSGLLGSPEIAHTGLNFKALMQPLIRPGTPLEITSRNTADYGKIFTSQTVLHTGDTFGDDFFTSGELLFFPPRFIQAD